MAKQKSIENLLKVKEKELLESWMKAQLANVALREDLMSEEDLRRQSTEFLRAFVRVVGTGNLEDVTAAEYKPIVKMLQEMSRTRAIQGYNASETVSYIFSLKDSLLNLMQSEYKADPVQLNTETIRISNLLDKLGIITFEEYARGREAVINEQQSSMMELSSPIVSLWKDILAVPVIGTLDSKRTQIIMENLLKRIVETGSKIAIIDITGVGIMDTLVATHLMKTVGAVKLLGAESVVTGIRPEVAQTVVHLGVDLGGIITRASLADGLSYAFKKLELKVVEGSQ